VTTTADEKNEQGVALDLASMCARSGDAGGFVKHLFGSGILDGLARMLYSKWPRIPKDQVDYLISEAVQATHGRLIGGQRISNVAGYLYKTAHFKAATYSRTHIVIADDVDVRDASAFETDDAESTSRARVFGAARDLIPALGVGHIRAVMSYVFDALEAGHDVSSHDVGDALGLLPSTVRTLRSRGFQRLVREARNRGLIAPDFALREAAASDEHLSEESNDDND